MKKFEIRFNSNEEDLRKKLKKLQGFFGVGSNTRVVKKAVNYLCDLFFNDKEK